LNQEEREAIAEFVVAICDSCRDVIDAGDQLINVLGKPILEANPSEKPTREEINSLKSTEQTSSKGQYQLVTKSENSDNPVFEKLRSYLKEKGGFVTLHGLKIWLFSNDPENRIGIRKK